MYRAYSNKEAREAERKAITSGVKMREIMERAGEALAKRVSAVMDEYQLKEVLFVLGAGSNACIGFIAARILMEQSKIVKVFSLSEKLSRECALAKMRYKGEILTRIPPKKKFFIVVDCVSGTGLKRRPEGDYAKLISIIYSQATYVISCDLPSGLSENGIALSPCVYADETVSIGCMKSSLILNDGPDHAGKVSVADIGLDYGKFGLEIWEDNDVKAFFPKKQSNVNKGTFGKSCIITSGVRMGAAMLAASASLRSGAGYTTLRIPDRFCAAAAAALPSCIVEDFTSLDEGILSSDALVIGMGSGVSKGLYSIITQLLNSYRGTLILDADALTALAEFGLKPLETKTCEVILTPHPKEFARLRNLSVQEVLDDFVSLAQRFAMQYDVTLILKNNKSIVTDGIRTAINNTGSPALAKCGSGDVLAGLLAGTCARGLAPFDAACVACYVFGRAGELAEEEFGQYAPISTDVIAALPRAIKSVTEIDDI